MYQIRGKDYGNLDMSFYVKGIKQIYIGGKYRQSTYLGTQTYPFIKNYRNMVNALMIINND